MPSLRRLPVTTPPTAAALLLRLVATSLLALAGTGMIPLHAQEARLHRAREIEFPTQCDGNSPSFWLDGRLHLFTSIGHPLRLSVADSQFDEWETRKVNVRDLSTKAIWVESAWVDGDGTIFGWYHHEPGLMYPDSSLTAPKIGAVVSFDGGRSIQDLGIILESGDALDDGAQNGFFTGGHGDFTVVLDRDRKHFYFFFTNYGGPAESQGVCVARMAFDDRFEPVGKVEKYHQGGWTEPGLGGAVTPIFAAARSWNHADPDSFWGPSVHWNTHLQCFVMLVNHAKGEPGWSQNGIYVSYSTDLSRPQAWKVPTKVLGDRDIPGWSTFYPQVMGLEEGGTDSHAGRVARLYLNGLSRWEIEFFVPPPPDEEP
ncbi:MAG: hypothetical protein HZC55_25065 [Verrucomicrobia bacterium]|nr:hypothetical protein [Verrucomicrobiota bacterium]